VLLLDPGQQEHLVVHRQPERDAEHQDRDRRVEGSGRGEVEKIGAVAVLEDPHHGAEGGAEAEHVEDDRLDRDEDAAGHQEEQHEGRHGDDAERQRDKSEDRSLGVDELRRRPRHQRRHARVQRPELGDELFTGWGHRLGVADHVQIGPVAVGEPLCLRAGLGHLGAVGERPRAGVHLVDLGQCRDSRRQLGGLLRRCLRQYDREGARGAVVELGAQAVTDDAGRAVGRQVTVVGEAEGDPEERRRKEDEQHHDREAGQDGSAHDRVRQGVPEAAIGGAVAPLAPDGEPVHPRSEDGEQRREGEDGRRRGDGDHRDACVGEGAQEVEREDQQRGQRDGHRYRAEDDGASGRLYRPCHGGLRVHTTTELFAEPRDDEEAVVDGRAEPECGGQVDGEDRNVGRQRHQVQRQERPEDRHRVRREREHRGDRTAEDHQEQHQRDRDRNRLGPGEVGADRLAESDTGPTDLHVQVTDRPVVRGLQSRRDGVGLLLVPGEPHQHQGLVPVRAAQTGVAAALLRCVPVRKHLLHPGLGRDLFGEVRASLRCRG